MAAKNDTVQQENELDTTQSASISYANEVVAIIAGMAAAEVEGIAGMSSVSGGIISKNRNITKGVKVEIGTEEASVDLYIVVEYGTPIQKAAQDAQENVRKAIESMTGLHVVRIDVHVQGVSFEKEFKSLEAVKQTAALNEGADAKAAKKEEKKQEPEAVKSEPVVVFVETAENQAAEETAEAVTEEKPN